MSVQRMSVSIRAAARTASRPQNARCASGSSAAKLLAAAAMLFLKALLLCIVSTTGLVAPPRRRVPLDARRGATPWQRDARRGAPLAAKDVPNPIAADAPGYAAALALQAVPLLDVSKESHYFFFLSLATLTVYLASRAPSLAPPEIEPLTLKQAALAPVFASLSLGLLYVLITYVEFDPSFFYRLVTSLYAGGACSLGLEDAAEATVGAGAAGKWAARGAAAALVAAYLLSDAVGLPAQADTAIANVLAWSLAILAVRAVPLRSFKVAALLLSGLFFYDVFFVFGTDIMVTVATRIEAPIKLIAPNPPGSANPASLLGLGDVALPGLAVALLGRYGDRLGDARWRTNAVAAYAVGLCLTFAANELRQGQPALLYLVPAVLGTGALTAFAAGGAEGVRELVGFEEPRDG
mmetsp:Transcript_7326/g.21650  ORF Transcript_7326/g.21650 Transcript_7326/m.21650 type:complete len:409 (-) Transcript_7326:8-1234(-)